MGRDWDGCSGHLALPFSLSLRPNASAPDLRATHPATHSCIHVAVYCCRGFVRALEDAVAIVDALAFPIDTTDREQMLKIVNSCIGTKFTMRFGSLISVRCAA